MPKVLIKKVPQAKGGAAFSPGKAKKILGEKNPTLQGHAITEKQRKWLGWQAGGAKAEDGASVSPIAKNVIQFNGPNHESGGIPISYSGKDVEVEGGETGYRSPLDNSLHIMGNMTNPLTGRKFKQDSKRLADKERKVDSLIKYSTGLVNDNDPTDKWDNLKFNAGKVMMQGGIKKKAELSENKEWLATLQKAMLEQAHEMGADPQEFSKGKLTAAKNGAVLIAQDGTTIDPDNIFGNPNMDMNFKSSFMKMMGEAPDFVKSGVKVGSGWRDPEEQQRLYQSGLKQWGPQGVRTRVAAPGRSAHQFGLAADLQFSDPKAREWVYSNANKYGIDFPLKKDDPNHMIFSAGMKGGRWQGPNSRLNFGPEDQTTYSPSPNDLLQFKPLGFNPDSIQTPTSNDNRVTPGDETLNFTAPQDYWKPSNAKPLGFDQILPEIYTAAVNKQEPVWMQQYHPQLFQPYKVSFQDRLNQQQANFNALLKANVHNPAAQSVLAGQSYEAANQVLGEEFRTNQGIEQEIVNKNVNLLNDAQLKNLSLADTQYVRKAETKSKVRLQNEVVLNSIADKVRQHELENRTLQVYENLYPNYYFDESGNMKLRYSGPKSDDWINWYKTLGAEDQANIQRRMKFDASGKKIGETDVQSSPMKYSMDRASLIKKTWDIMKEKKSMFPTIQRSVKSSNIGVSTKLQNYKPIR